jgi:hypothetical protein
MKCKSCQAEILWVRTESGKLMPCDPLLESFITQDGRVARGYKSHFSTCPHANAWRKKNKDRPTGGPADQDKEHP